MPTYEPLLAPLCIFLSFAAVPIASALRPLGGHTAHQPLPQGWTPKRSALFALKLLGFFVALSLLPLIIEPTGEALLSRDRLGAEALATLSARAWQMALLTAPLGVALWIVTELRWPRIWLMVLAVATSLPLPALVVALLLPKAVSPWDHLLIWTTLVGASLWLALSLPKLKLRWLRWRRPVVEITRASALPSHLAARVRLELMEAPTTRTPPLSVQ